MLEPATMGKDKLSASHTAVFIEASLVIKSERYTIVKHNTIKVRVPTC